MSLIDSCAILFLLLFVIVWVASRLDVRVFWRADDELNEIVPDDDAELRGDWRREPYLLKHQSIK